MRTTLHDEKPYRGHLRTRVSRRLAIALSLTFLVGLYGVALLQTRDSPTAAIWRRLFAHAPSKQHLAEIERELEEASGIRAAVRPWLQELLSRHGGFGNGNAVLGRDGWLFYAPGVAYVAGPGFLRADVHAVRCRAAVETGAAAVHPDPRPAILDLAAMLARRGIRLVLLPVPDKASVEARALHGRLSDRRSVPVVGNPDQARFAAEMRAAGITVIDAAPDTVAPGAPPLFLRQDTHWTPAWMEATAAALAREVEKDLSSGRARVWRRGRQHVAGAGDLVDMLKLSPTQTLFPPESVTIRPVKDERGQSWQPREDTEVLLLGDSFTNIFSAAAMGWGSAAGFGPQLAAALGHEVDVIARNDAGAHATRVLLARELSAGRDRLAGKKVVIWQFAVRELAVGDWRPVAWTEAPRVSSAVASFFVPPNEPVVVHAVVAEASSVPRPGEVPYKDHIRALRLRELPGGQETLAYIYSMRDHAWTAAARLQPGARISVRLRAWAAVSSELEAVNRSELSDEALLAAEPAWAELQ